MAYDIEAMKRALAQCDVNIRTFEEAIAKEMETKSEYRRIIDMLESQRADNG